MTPKSIARSLVRMAKRPFRRRPRIIMTLLCRDEEDIIGYNIAYHLAQGVDFVIVTDNASRDRTPRLLERFVKRPIASAAPAGADPSAGQVGLAHGKNGGGEV
jgi:hypothetical protein